MEVRANFNELKGAKLLAPLTGADEQRNRLVPPGHREEPRASAPVDEVMKSPNFVLAEEFDVYSAAGHLPESLQELLRAKT